MKHTKEASTLRYICIETHRIWIPVASPRSCQTFAKVTQRIFISIKSNCSLICNRSVNASQGGDNVCNPGSRSLLSVFSWLQNCQSTRKDVSCRGWKTSDSQNQWLLIRRFYTPRNLNQTFLMLLWCVLAFAVSVRTVSMEWKVTCLQIHLEEERGDVLCFLCGQDQVILKHILAPLRV